MKAEHEMERALADQADLEEAAENKRRNRRNEIEEMATETSMGGMARPRQGVMFDGESGSNQEQVLELEGATAQGNAQGPPYPARIRPLKSE
jgi:hypothetical protein